LFEDALLCPRGMEGKNPLDGFADSVVEFEGDPGASAHTAAFQLHSHLQEKELFKDQPPVRGCAGIGEIGKDLAGLREMNALKGQAAVDQMQTATESRGYAIRDGGRKVAERSMDDAPEPARGQLAARGGLIDGNDASNLERFDFASAFPVNS